MFTRLCQLQSLVKIQTLTRNAVGWETLSAKVVSVRDKKVGIRPHRDPLQNAVACPLVHAAPLLYSVPSFKTIWKVVLL